MTNDCIHLNIDIYPGNKPSCYYQACVFYKSMDTNKWNLNFVVIQDTKYSEVIGLYKCINYIILFIVCSRTDIY